MAASGRRCLSLERAAIIAPLRESTIGASMVPVDDAGHGAGELNAVPSSEAGFTPSDCYANRRVEIVLS